jgi:CubicO group peptidase (beta-lactamase class C family)
MPMETDTVLRVASMTKLVTTIAVLMLCEDGKLDLDDTLAQHLPGFEQPEVLASFDHESGSFTVRESGGAITIRQLLTHTSGFGFGFLDR